MLKITVEFPYSLVRITATGCETYNEIGGLGLIIC
jgi:hypothetical protein